MKWIVFFICLVFSSQALSKESYRHPLDNMPIMDRLSIELRGYSPIEQREEEYRRFLSPSVGVQVSNGSGSGSIIYYDKKNNLAYVASCGHLWNKGVLTAAEAKSKNISCRIVTWYKKNVKLNRPESFEAKLLFYSYTDQIDTSLIVFSPDWEPEYFPIAPIDYKYNFGSIAHSCGCDGAKEVAHYEVTLLELNEDLVTTKNSPRPGRSGGGLFDDQFYIGTCWGTEYVDGSGQGFFTPIKDIHKFWGSQKDYDFLLKTKPKIKAKNLPVVNRNRMQKNYSQDYILVP